MLTCRENEILGYAAAGLSVKEIADHIDRSVFTVQKIICNVKEKIGLQKATELVAYYFCQRLDMDFAEFKRQMLSACLAVLMMFGEYSPKFEDAKARSAGQSVARVRMYRGRRRDEEFNQLYII